MNTNKLFWALMLLTSHCLGFAQFSVNTTGAHLQINSEQNIDAIFLFDKISSTTEITYTGNENIEWRKYDNSFVANTKNFSPEDATGYIVFDKINNKPLKYIWVIDYSLYPIVYNSLTTEGSCGKLTLNTSLNAPELVYYDKSKVRKILPRIFTLKYTDYAFTDGEWKDSPVETEHQYPFTQIELNAPRKDVNICIEGDKYAKEMGISVQKTCVDYKAVAVECHIKGTIEKRSGTNEYKRDDSNTTTLTGSGPLVVLLESKSNTPTAAFHEWKIYKTGSAGSYFRYSEENVRYTFNETGEFVAKLQVTNADNSCVSQDSIKISVLESLLDVPNAFTPNGDGINDEFRVVFKSIKTYKITIFNRWGQVVYQRNDPSKGWDGRIGGKPAAMGTYYYIIDATGTDTYSNGSNQGKNVVHNRKGHINLFR